MQQHTEQITTIKERVDKSLLKPEASHTIRVMQEGRPLIAARLPIQMELREMEEVLHQEDHQEEIIQTAIHQGVEEVHPGDGLQGEAHQAEEDGLQEEAHQAEEVHQEEVDHQGIILITLRQIQVLHTSSCPVKVNRYR